MFGYVFLPCILLPLIYAAPPTEIHFTIEEEAQVGKEVGNVAQESNLLSKHGAEVFDTLTFRILGDDSPQFMIEPKGLLKTAQRIDREAICPNEESCTAELRVAVMPYQYFSLLNVFVKILDKNDNSPKFPSQKIRLEIPESSPKGAVFTVPAANDLDTKMFSVKRYELSEGTEHFSLRYPQTNVAELSELELVLNYQLDREKEDNLKVVINAYDGGSPAKIGSLIINITVTDFNDFPPTFGKSKYSVTINENSDIGTVIAKLNVTDKDTGNNAKAFFRFASTVPRRVRQIFGINTNNGDIYLQSYLDYEKASLYNLKVEAVDGGLPALTGRTEVEVNVVNLNDNKPKITISALLSSDTPSVEENSNLETFVAHILVTDQDKDSRDATCALMNSPDFTLRHLHSSEFTLLSTKSFDYETKNIYNVTVECSDNGVPPLSSTRSFFVSVIDINEHAPEFEKDQYTNWMRENEPPNRYVLQVKSTDKDGPGENSDVVYSLSSEADGKFKIHSKSGVITTVKSLDYEEANLISFDVIARDQGRPPIGSLSSRVPVKIFLTDVNDNVPKWGKPAYEFSVFENATKNTILGTLSATDPDATSEPPQLSLNYSYDGANHFDLQKAGKNWRLILRDRVDREKRENYLLYAVATDSGTPPKSSQVPITVHVKDVNDNGPIVIFPTRFNNSVYISYLMPPGGSVTKIEAFDPDSGKNGELHYTIFQQSQQNYFNLNGKTGEVTLAKKISYRDMGSHQLVVVITDQGADANHKLSEMSIVITEPHGLANGFRGDQLSDKSLMVIIGLVVVCAIVSVFIIVIIVVIRRRYYGNPASNVEKGPRMEMMMSHPVHVLQVPREGSDTNSTNSGRSGASADIPLIRPNMQTNPPLTPINEHVLPQSSNDNTAYSTGTFRKNQRPIGMKALPYNPPQAVCAPYSISGVQKTGEETASNMSNCDSGKGTSEEDLRKIKGESTTDQNTTGYHGNSNMQSFQNPASPNSRRQQQQQQQKHNLSSPPPDIVVFGGNEKQQTTPATNSHSPPNSSGGESNDHFYYSCNQIGAPLSPNAGAALNNDGSIVQVMPEPINIVGSRVTADYDLMDGARSRFEKYEQYTVV